jgi:ADP-heptose:LPS heptosyltransferase
MFYFLIILITYPFRFFLKKHSQNKRALLIQTAKIGDYVNSSCILDPLSKKYKIDIIIDKSNKPLVKSDDRINNIYFHNEYKHSMCKKIKMAFFLFKNRYDCVIVHQPNQLNLFLGSFCMARYSAALQTYKTGWSGKLLLSQFSRIINHGRTDLTLVSYGKCLEEVPSAVLQKKLPECKIRKDLEEKINLITCPIAGVALSSGNKIKQIPDDEWEWIFAEIFKNNGMIVVIGMRDDISRLNSILEKLSSYEDKIVSLLGETDLAEMPALMKRFKLLVCADTGPAYIADSVNVPVLLFAGPCEITEQRPVGEKCHFVLPNVPGKKQITYVFETIHNGNFSDYYKTSSLQRLQVTDFLTNQIFHA